MKDSARVQRVKSKNVEFQSAQASGVHGHSGTLARVRVKKHGKRENDHARVENVVVGKWKRKNVYQISVR